MIYTSVIFDLDGTLIDSAPAILSSLNSSFDALGLKPDFPLEKKLIGPPISDIVRSVLAAASADKLAQVEMEFKKQYDDSGCLKTQLYDGVVEMLDHITGAGVDVYIATNKRSIPTAIILKHLAINHYFKAVYSLDSAGKKFANKTDMISALLAENDIDRNQTVYVGDRSEDGHAAEKCHIPFILAAWGYGEQMDSGTSSASSALMLGHQVLESGCDQ